METYQLFKGLTSPAKPVEKMFNELVTLMINHENPKRNPIAEIFQLNMHNKQEDRRKCITLHGRTKKTHQYCQYGNSLDSMLRDRLVCGINHDHMQQRLLSEGANLFLQKAMDISRSLESMIKQAAAIQNEFKQPNEAVSKLNRKLHQEIRVQSVFDLRIYTV